MLDFQKCEIIKEMVEKATLTINLSKKSRKREIVENRAIYYSLCRRFTKLSSTKIGLTLARDHATVLHGLKIFKNLTETGQGKRMLLTYQRLHTELYPILVTKSTRKNPRNQFEYITELFFQSNKYRSIITRKDLEIETLKQTIFNLTENN